MSSDLCDIVPRKGTSYPSKTILTSLLFGQLPIIVKKSKTDLNYSFYHDSYLVSVYEILKDEPIFPFLFLPHKRGFYFTYFCLSF